MAVAGAFAVGYRAAEHAPVAAPGVVDEVRSALAARYYRPVPERVLRLTSVDQMIAALGDPYTTYLAPTDYRLVEHETASAYGGIGVSLLPSSRGLVVVSLRDPARIAGVRLGDTIVRVGGASVTALGASRAAARILGPAGSTVRLGIVRHGRRLVVRVRRSLVRAPVVEARLLSFAGRRWGDVRLSAFRAGAVVVLRREVRRLRREGAAGFVLDLRDNPGGLLAQAVDVASLFVGSGVVATLDGFHQPREVLEAVPHLVVTKLPLVVLVDRYTASSAEVVASALRDHGRATIVGERTYGKGVVQAVDPLPNGAALELTIARWSGANGEDVGGVGLAPQVQAPVDPLGVALRVLARPAS